MARANDKYEYEERWSDVEDPEVEGKAEVKEDGARKSRIEVTLGRKNGELLPCPIGIKSSSGLLRGFTTNMTLAEARELWALLGSTLEAAGRS
jgi:hypothetical protein